MFNWLKELFKRESNGGIKQTSSLPSVIRVDKNTASIQDPQLHRMADLSGEARRRALVHPIYSGNSEQMANYVVWSDGITVYAVNGENGTIDYSGSDAATIIQNALDGLTSSRTWRETVVVKGNLTITTGITIPSYTRLDLYGCVLTESNSFGNDGIFTIEKGTTEIDIFGGVLNGNDTNQTATVDNWGIYFGGIGSGAVPTNLHFKDIITKNFLWAGIVGSAENSIFENLWSNGTGNLSNTTDPPHAFYFDQCEGIFIKNLFSDGDSNGLKISNSSEVYVDNCIIRNCVANAGGQTTSSFLIQAVDNSKFSNIYIDGTATLYGLEVSGTSLLVNNLEFSNIYIMGALDGFYLLPGSGANTNVRINGGEITACRNRGIFFGRTNYGSISNILVHDNNVAVGGYPDIRIAVCNDIQLSNIQTYGSVYGIALSDSCTNVIIENCDLVGNTNGVDVSGISYGLILRNNLGFITEKQGTAAILSGTNNIAVNLSGTIKNVSGSPTTVLVSVNSSGYGNLNYYPSNFNSGSFTIYTPSNTSANVILSYHATYQP